VSAVIGPAIAILTLPVFARVFTQAEYGVLELGTTLTSRTPQSGDNSRQAAGSPRKRESSRPQVAPAAT
jgi:hypothetical protein